MGGLHSHIDEATFTLAWSKETIEGFVIVFLLNVFFLRLQSLTCRTYDLNCRCKVKQFAVSGWPTLTRLLLLLCGVRKQLEDWTMDIVFILK